MGCGRMQMTDLLAKKRDGGCLSTEEIDFMIQGYTRGTIPDYQMSAMCMAILLRGMDDREILDMTMSMMHSGETLDLSPIRGVKADKHSTGGVGDKTSLVLCPMVAATGLKIAKMSGRGLGHTGGTIDKLESFPGFSTAISEETFFQNVNDIGIAIMGQTADLVPADKKSGDGAFMKTEAEARKLAEGLTRVGRLAGRKCAAVITDMDQPLGYTVGNALEVKEALAVLHGEKKGELLELCLTLGSLMLVEAGVAWSVEEAKLELMKTIEDGSALWKLAQMVRAQGGNERAVYDPALLPQAKIQKEVPSPAAGYVSHIKAEQVGLVSMHLGGGRATKEDTIDLSVGVVLHKKVGDRVEAGESLGTIHASDEEKANRAVELLQSCYELSAEPVKKPVFIKAIVR